MNMKLIKIGATWCGGCKALDIQLKQLKEIDVISLDVEKDFDEVEKLPKVRNLPTLFVVDGDNNVVHTWVGLVRANDITEKIKTLKET